MKNICAFIVLVLGLGLLEIGAASGHVLHCSASEVAVLPDDGTSVAKVAFRFDLSGLRGGTNRHIEKAILEWRLSDLPEEKNSPEFFVVSVLQTWSRESISNRSVPSTSSERVSSWQVNPLALETSGGKLVRLEITELVEAWADGTGTNYGVVVATPDLSIKLIAAQLGKARLTVLYSFRGSD